MVKINQFTELLKPIGTLAGCEFVWHSLNNAVLEGASGVSLFHGNLYCSRVKEDAACRRACVNCHWHEEPQRAIRECKPFVHTCFAGVSEVAIPIFQDNLFRGVIYAGAFAAANVSPLGLQKEYSFLIPYRAEMGSAIAELVGQLLTLLPPELPNSPTYRILPEKAIDNRISDRLLKAVLAIHSMYAEKLSVDCLAHRAGVGDSRLQHLFKEELGMSCVEYLQRFRITRARSLVELTSLPMSEIAEMCGIFDQARLTVLFHRYFQMTPLECRKSAGYTKK